MKQDRLGEKETRNMTRASASRRLFAGSVMASLALAGASVAGAAEGEVRCGWFSNPSPGNASLYDKDGEWTIAVQGGHQAEGDWPPKFPPGGYAATGRGSYGYGCACLRVVVDKAENNVLRIISGKGRPLAICRGDKTLRGIEASLK